MPRSCVGGQSAEVIPSGSNEPIPHARGAVLCGFRPILLSLSKVAEELLVIARESQGRIDGGRTPLWGLRILAVLAIIAIGRIAVIT